MGDGDALAIGAFPGEPGFHGDVRQVSDGGFGWRFIKGNLESIRFLDGFGGLASGEEQEREAK